MNILYRITHTILIWIFPVLLILTSFVIMVPQVSQHKAAVAYGGFYTELSNTLQNPPNQEEYSTETVVLRAAFEDLATPEWLENIVNTNIDNFVEWVLGDAGTWEVFIPTQDVQENVARTVDNEVEQILDDSSSQIQPCDSERSQNIRRNGLSFDEGFCLPPSVISGEETLTEFMGINDEELSESFFSSFLAQNPFTSENLSVDQVFPDSELVGFFDGVRSAYQWLSENLWIIWLVFFGFIAGHLMIAKASDKTFLGQTQRILLLTGTNTLILSLVIILFVAGGNYISSSLVRFLLPGLVINQIQNMILLRVVLVVAGLMQLAIITSIVFIVARVALSVLKNMGIIGNVKEKNKRLTNTQTNLKKNPTLDGEFRRKVLSDGSSQDSIRLAGITQLEESAAPSTPEPEPSLSDTSAFDPFSEEDPGLKPASNSSTTTRKTSTSKIPEASPVKEKDTPPVILNVSEPVAAKKEEPIIPPAHPQPTPSTKSDLQPKALTPAPKPKSKPRPSTIGGSTTINSQDAKGVIDNTSGASKMRGL
jgi:hypothetical protein